MEETNWDLALVNRPPSMQPRGVGGERAEDGARPRPLWLAQQQLRARLIALRSQPPPSVSTGSCGALRLERGVDESTEPVHWLLQQGEGPCIYSRHGAVCVAGIGEAHRLCIAADTAASMSEWQTVAASLPVRMRYYGAASHPGIAAAAATAAEWSGFGSGVFVSPAVELQRCADGRCFLACHLRWAPHTPSVGDRNSSDTVGLSPHCDFDQAVELALSTLLRAHSTASDLPPASLRGLWPLERCTPAPPATTAAAIGSAVGDDLSQQLVYRRETLDFGGPVQIRGLLLQLLGSEHTYGAGIRYASGRLSGPSVHARSASEAVSACGDARTDCTPVSSMDAAVAASPAARPASVLMLSLAHSVLSDPSHASAQASGDGSESACPGSSVQHQAAEAPGFIVIADDVSHTADSFHAAMADAALGSVPLLQSAAALDPGLCLGPFGSLGPDGSTLCLSQQGLAVHANSVVVYGTLRLGPGADGALSVDARMDTCQLRRLFPTVAARSGSEAVDGGGADVSAEAATPSGSAAASAIAGAAAADTAAAVPFRERFARSPNVNALFCSALVEELERGGLGFVFICPGSRSTPLTAAVAASRLPHTIVTDERGAAYAAVGFARATGRCAAVIVTSGTAVANLLPAVMEVAAQRVPLLLLTADRPAELRDTGANQTVAQVGALTPLRWFKDLPPPAPTEPLAAWLADAAYALHSALRHPRGAVQLNVMLREPLAPSPAPWPAALLDPPAVRAWLSTGRPFTVYAAPTAAPSGVGIETVAGILNGARRGLLVAGGLDSSEDRIAAAALAHRLGWPLLADVTSGLRAVGNVVGAERLVPLYDMLLSCSAAAAAAAPDVVLMLGGRVISKRLQALVESRSVACVLLEPHGQRHDPSHCVTHRLHGSVSRLVDALCQRIPPEAAVRAPYAPPRVISALCDASAELDDALETALARGFDGTDGDAAPAPLSEAWIARHVCGALSSPGRRRQRLADAARVSGGRPSDVLFSSSSLPIRHLDMYCARTPLVLCNRGASGIDGVVHAALGAALANPLGSTALLIGDVATLHDLGALAALASHVACPLVVVVLNNGGGGIFRYLPIARHDGLFSPYFDTPHSMQLGGVCGGFGLPYTLVREAEHFAEAYATALARGSVSVIEAAVEREDTFQLHQRLCEVARQVAERVLLAER